MQTQIDNLVRSIQQDLTQPAPSVPELASFFEAIGADGLSLAGAKRAILARWSEDANFLPSVRQYAKRQLEALPTF
nr:hypothetical protein [uncultured Aquabacterium sp.]